MQFSNNNIIVELMLQGEELFQHLIKQKLIDQSESILTMRI